MNPDNVVLSIRNKMLRVRLVVPDNVTPSSSLTIDSTGGDDSKTISKVSDHIISQTVREKGLVCFRTAATLRVTSRSSLTVFGLASVLQMALTLLVILLSMPPALSEVVFHRRDHTDQGNYGASPPSYNVRSYSEALVYLHKYGYLSNCTLPVRRRRRHQPFQLPFSPGEGSVMRNDAGSSLPEEHICSDFEVRSALRRLQQRFDLDASGRLDDDTKLLMSRGRCGNTDSDDRRRQLEAEPQTILREVDSVGDSNDEDPSGNEIGHETNRRLERGRRHRKRRSPSSSSSSFGSTSSAGSRGVTGSRGIADFSGQVIGQPPPPLIDIDALFEHIVPDEPVNQIELSRRRRMEQLREMTTLRQQQEERQQRHSVGVVSNKAKDTTTPSEGELVTGSSGIVQQLQQFVQDSRFDEQLQRIQEHRRRRRKRRRRSISFTSFADHVLEGPSSGVEKDQMRFRKDDDSPVQWRLLDGGVSGKIPLKDQHDILELAFRMWSEVIPLRFSETNDMVAVQDTDIIIAFAKQNHMNCDKPFDGNGGELAHSWTGGDIHFDEDENYRRDDPSGSGINLLKVAVHEIGHVLGLLHTDRGESIMYPIYVNPAMYDSFELARDDRRAVQNIYGVCKGSFDVVFDWLRKVRSPDGASIRYIFNTYFFRGSRYWMYENRFNRTRYGDPLYVSREWTGLPNTIDAYVQIITSSGTVASGSRPPEYLIDTYFFSGDSYYKYDDEMDRVSDGYPRKIAAGFGPKPGGTDAVPNSLDAVLFDNRDSLLYFFKGDWVWVYNPRDIGRNSCCERKVTFSSLFPLSSVDSITEYTSSSSSSSSNSSSLPSSTAAAIADQPSQAISLTGNISAVFYSYHFRSMFVFDGETVYENVAYDEHTPGVNRLVRRGPWYNIWFDICDVD